MPERSSPDITGLSAEAHAELERLLAAEGVDGAIGQTITPRAAGAPTPASFSQELLWMLDRATPGLTAYNLPMARRLRGGLDVAALERALSAVAARHESLRTRFAEGDRHPVQVIDPPAPVVLRRVDLGSVPAGDREQRAVREVSERARLPIDLAHEPSFRITLLRLADDDHVLLIETHHIVADGWSMGIIFRELAAAYTAARAGHEPDFPPLPIQFGDVAVWERERLAGARLEELLSFWRTQLGAAAGEPLALPTDFARPSTPTFAGAVQGVLVPAAQLAALRQFGQSHQATLYMTLLAAYATVLHRYTGRADVLIGSGSAGRTLPETEGVVGYLNNTLVQRADFSGDPTFAELLGRVRTSAVGAYDHQDIPLEKLVLELRQGEERLSDASLFEVVLTMQDTIGGSLSLENVTVEPFGMNFGATKFDLTLLVTEREQGLELAAQYRSDLFAPGTMRRFLGHIVQVLDSAIVSPGLPVSTMPLLTEGERAELAGWNDTTTEEGPPATMVDLFEAQAARVAGRVAVTGPNGVVLTYEELNARANQLAHHLQRAGVAPGARVSLLLDRSADAIVGLLGILKAGAVYVPLSVDAPPARLAQQMAECGSTVAVTSAAGAEKLPAGVSAVLLDGEADGKLLGAQLRTNPPSVVTADALAYVLFTSGSTGTPKGVAVTHANLVHYTRAISSVLGLPLDGTVTPWHFGTVSTLAADLGYTSVFPALASGGTLHVLPADVGLDASRFQAYLAAHPLDLLKITPSHLQALAGPEFAPEHLPRRWLVLGGEACPWSLVEAVRSRSSVRVLNHYGPTETTVGAITFEVGATDVTSWAPATVPIGRPLPNVTADVLDTRQQPVPVGIPGELWVGGAGVTRGYLGREDLTLERFVGPAGARRYRTGDRVRRLPSGDIEFLGRLDTQVKVRGHRVELGEIEAVLATHPSVRQAVVVLHGDTLVAYLVEQDPRPDAELAAHVARALPDYMVPAAWVRLDTLPLTANGKVDRAKLPAPTAEGAGAPDGAPRTDIERTLAALWADILKKDAVGRHDNFVALGGHSLLAIRLLGRLAKLTGIRLSLRTLFEHPTIAELATVLEPAAGPESKETGAPASGPSAPSRASRESFRRPATHDPKTTGGDR
jgi:amino acid adenylation domain-containing protein